MGKAPKSLMKFDFWLWNDDDPEQPHHHRLAAGIRERLEASTHYKKPVGEVLQTGNEEALAYLCWLAAKRYDVVGDDVKFDKFVEQLVSIEDADGDLAEQLEGVLVSEGIEDPEVRRAAAAAAVAAIADVSGDSEGDPDGGRDE